MQTHATASSTTARETDRLIASDKVEGTSVVRSNGETVGRIERVMIDKRSGQVAYAVMSFGGFLGLGESYYPLPWSILRYNEDLDGYEVNLTEDQLRSAPNAQDSGSFNWSDRNFSNQVDSYYGSSTNWQR